jgi:hypothetical protein
MTKTKKKNNTCAMGGIVFHDAFAMGVFIVITAVNG